MARAIVAETDLGPFWTLQYVAEESSGEQLNLSLPQLGTFPVGTFNIEGYETQVPSAGMDGVTLTYYAEPVGDTASGKMFKALYEAETGKLIVGAPSDRIDIEIQDVEFKDASNKVVRLSGSIQADLSLNCHPLGVRALPDASAPSGNPVPVVTGGDGLRDGQAEVDDPTWSTPFCMAQRPR